MKETNNIKQAILNQVNTGITELEHLTIKHGDIGAGLWRIQLTFKELMLLRQALTAPRVPDGWRQTISQAASHLGNWLDMNECECEGPHYCGRRSVEVTRHQLLDMLNANSTTAPAPADDNGDEYADFIASEGHQLCGDLLDAMVDSVTAAPAEPELLDIPKSLRRLSNFEEHGQQVINEQRAELARLREQVKELEELLIEHSVAFDSDDDWDELAWHEKVADKVGHLIEARLLGEDK